MYKVLLCLRYLRTRYIALASIISVMLGVATMIVVNSVMAGFSTEMRERIHGILADVVIETNSYDGAPDADGMMEAVKAAVGEYVDGMTATVEVFGMLNFQYGGQWVPKPVTLIGIKPEGKAKVSPLVDYLDSYHELKENGVVVRKSLRSKKEPPGWELTAPARAHRQIMTQRNRWIQEQYGSAAEPSIIQTAANETAHGSQSSAETSVTPPAHDSAAGEPNRQPDQPSAAAKEPLPGAADDSPAVASEGDLLSPPKELRPPDFSADPPPATVDPAAPLEARAYVGIELVSFKYENQETGKLETEMMVEPGDDIQISTVRASQPPEPTHFDATVVDLFKSGMSEYDSNIIFCNLEALQKYRGMIAPSGAKKITSIQIKLKNFEDARAVVTRLKGTFPPDVYTVRTWEQKQGPLLAAVDVESAILNVLLFLIIAVAGFGILAIFFMIVVEKTRDIGILKALGASSRGVMSIFLGYGLALGIVGSGVGVAIGLLFVRYINVIETWITWMTGRKVFDEKIYYFPEIPTAVHPGMVIGVAVGAMAIAVLASILPARRASRLHPVEALRYE